MGKDLHKHFTKIYEICIFKELVEGLKYHPFKFK